MPEVYLELSAKDQKDILQTAATKLGREISVLEKDVWVCWALQALFSMPDRHPMVFKGGTSLSKAYDIINRFSEDIDITIDYRSLEDKNYPHYPEKVKPFDPGTSKNQKKQYSERLKKYVRDYAQERVKPYLQSELDKLPTKKEHTIEVIKDEQIRVQYPPVAEYSDEYLKSEILIELGGRNAIDPKETHEIRPYIASTAEGISYPSSRVDVLSPERTFWEKATLIHVECNRGYFTDNADRLSRHWYDLVMLAKHEKTRAAVKDREILADVVKYKKVFFNSSYANYDDCLSGKLKLLPKNEMRNQLQSDYEQMISSKMMYQEPPPFSDIIDAIEKIENQVNGESTS